MSYEYGQKIRIQNSDFVITILSVNNPGQPVIANPTTDRVYNIECNGVTQQVKEKFLNALIESEKKVDLITEKVIRKRGRPRKVR